MKIGIVRFPGTNNEHETLRALRSFEVDAEILDYQLIDKVGSYDGYWLAGGFSYADVLRAGAIASQSQIVSEIKKSGKPALGVCNGFQIMTEASLLPGALMPNKSTRFICKWVHVKVSDHPTFQEHSGKVLRLPIAHFEGNLYTAQGSNHPHFVKYTDDEGKPSTEFNPNGSVQNIAGLAKDNYMGLMPHPERASFKHQGSTDGRYIIQAFLNEVKN